MIPSDPRTWTDFSNPESRGFDKVDCHTALERALMFGAQMLGIFAAIVGVTYEAFDLSWQSLPKLIAVLMLVLLIALAAVYFLAGR